MPTLSEQLASGIRLRDQRSIEIVLREGANPNMQVNLLGDERFGASQAPVIYLAIHYDLPEMVKLLAHMGAHVHLAYGSGLTPRAHAAWMFRWQCVDAFDQEGRMMMDDETILTVIATHWSNPNAGMGLEDVFFHRLDRVSPNFSINPEAAFGVVVGVLFGWEGYRVLPLKRLMDDEHFILAAKGMRAALEAMPSRFIPHYAKMHAMASRFLGGKDIPEEALEMLLDMDIPLCPPAHILNEGAYAWLARQQARANAITCRGYLEGGTVEAAGRNHGGRL